MWIFATAPCWLDGSVGRALHRVGSNPASSGLDFFPRNLKTVVCIAAMIYYIFMPIVFVFFFFILGEAWWISSCSKTW